MLTKDNIQEILNTISKNKLRTFLTGFSVSLGIFLYVVLSGLGNGLINYYNNLYGKVSLNTIRIIATETALPYKGLKAKRTITFDNGDLTALEKQFQTTIEYLTPVISNQSFVTFENKGDLYSIKGVSPGHLISENSLIMQGRFINYNDTKEGANYAVIGRMVEKELFERTNAVGKMINISGNFFKIIGVFQDEGGTEKERRIYLPFTTLQHLENIDKFQTIIVAYNKDVGHKGAKSFEEKLISFLGKRKTVSPNDYKGFKVTNMIEEYQKTMLFAKSIQLIIGLITLGLIVSSIIGISNIMVYSVKERFKEIGIRKAIGATPSRIALAIMLESFFLSVVFGIIGLILGVLLLKMFHLTHGNSLQSEYLVLNPGINMLTALFIFFLLVLSGAIAAYIPARKASKIKPIEAIRNE